MYAIYYQAPGMRTEKIDTGIETHPFARFLLNQYKIAFGLLEKAGQMWIGEEE